MVVFARPLAPEVITVVTVPIPSFMSVPIVIVTMVAVVDPPTVVAIIISLRNEVGLLISSHLFSD